MGIGTAVPDDWVVLPKPDVDHYALYKHIKRNLTHRQYNRKDSLPN
jgi:hypothetical protein